MWNALSWLDTPLTSNFSCFPAFLISFSLLKLARCPCSLAPTLVTLPSISRAPRAPFFLFSSSFLLLTFTRNLPREIFVHRHHPGRTGGFSGKTRRRFLSRETDYGLDLQKARRLVRRDDGFA